MDLFNRLDYEDVANIVLGTFGSSITGLSLPVIYILSGRILDELNKNPETFSDGIVEIVTQFLIVAGINLFSGLVQVIT